MCSNFVLCFAQQITVSLGSMGSFSSSLSSLGFGLVSGRGQFGKSRSTEANQEGYKNFGVEVLVHVGFPNQRV
jgi:hypothetical protein